MERINIKITQQPHFIGCWKIKKENLCKEVINFFENNKTKQFQGVTSGGKDILKKSRTDLQIKPNDLKDPKYLIIKEYIDEVHKCYLDYLEQWPFLKKMLKDIDIGSFNIGKYQKGDHFSVTHTERSGLNNLHRLFAWMTYLNDVEDGGQTNFTHYNVKIKPEEGKTLIWPAEWTHAHTGEILKSGTKYIVTGWMHFPIET